MSRQFVHILTFLLFLSVSLFAGCIHTYPENGGFDPGLTYTALEIRLDNIWSHLALDYDVATKSVATPHLRITAEITGGGQHGTSISAVVPYEDVENDIFVIPLSSPLPQTQYSLSLWCDFVSPDSQEPYGYDVSSPHEIRPLFGHGEFSFLHDCWSHTCKFDLKGDGHGDGSIAMIPIVPAFPSGRFRIVATDYEIFIAAHADEIRRGDTFMVVVEYNDEIPEAFNLYEGSPCRPEENVTFSTPLDIISIPGIEMAIAADRLFALDTPMDISLSITVFDSAKTVVAKTTGVSFPIERGKVTTISGDFLTNIISGGITIDTAWEGEITIDLQENQP